MWTPEAKYELVAKVLAGQSNNSVCYFCGYQRWNAIYVGSQIQRIRLQWSCEYNCKVKYQVHVSHGSPNSVIHEPLDISSMKYFKIRLKTFLMTSIILSLTRSMWICNISTSTAPSLKQTQTSIPGYGRRLPKSSVTSFTKKSLRRLGN